MKISVISLQLAGKTIADLVRGGIGNTRHKLLLIY